MDTINIGLTGDVMLGRGVDATLRQQPPEYVWGDMIDVLRHPDFTFVNLECALTHIAERAPDGSVKPFYFRSSPHHVDALLAAGVDCVSIANNHICDFGTEGLLETIHTLDTAGIAHAGAGTDARAAMEPAVLRHAGRAVALVAFADHPLEWAAGPDRPGFNYTPVTTAATTFHRIEQSLRIARDAADFVIFSIHWGPNMRERPSESFRQFARAVMDEGADLFWGHSAHVLQGIEIYRGKPILYDTGDFIDDYAVDLRLRNDLGALFRVVIEAGRVASIEIRPVKISGRQVNKAAGAEREWVGSRLSRLSAELGTHIEVTPHSIAVPVSHFRRTGPRGSRHR